MIAGRTQRPITARTAPRVPAGPAPGAPPQEPPGLFEVTPELGGRTLWPAEKVWPADATWTRHKGAHQGCGICVRLAIQMGVQKAPPIAAAHWRRKGPNGDLFVCAPHGLVLKPKDEEVRARLAEVRASMAIPKPRKQREV